MTAHPPDLGDVVVMLLAATLAGLRDRLAADGFMRSAELVAELVDVADLYLVDPNCSDCEPPAV